MEHHGAREVTKVILPMLHELTCAGTITTTIMSHNAYINEV
jgi:hypothetical protein